MAYEMDEDRIIPVDDYNALYLEDYKGYYGLYALTKGQNDVWYKKWVFLSKWSKGSGGFVAGPDKRPMAVRLGEKHEAVKALEAVFRQLKA